MSEVKSTHTQQATEHHRGRTPPLLPGGLPGPQGRVLDELMGREATTRVRPVNTAELAVINSPPEAPPGAGGAGAADGSLDGGRVDSKRVVVSDGKGHVIRPELSIQSDAEIGSGDLERIVETLPPGALKGDAGPPGLLEVDAGVRRNGGADGVDAQPAETTRSAAGAAAEEPRGHALLEKTVDFSDGDAEARSGQFRAADGGPDGDRAEGSQDEQGRPWWKFGWGPEDSFSEPPPQRKSKRQRKDEEVASREAGAEEQGEGEFWGWAKGMAILAGLRQRQQDPQTAAQAAEDGEKRAKEAAKKEGTEAAASDEQGDPAWWAGLLDMLKRDDSKKAADGGKKVERGEQRTEDDRALSTVIVSPDVPIEEIAAEIARVKNKQAEQSAEQKRQLGEDMLRGPVGQLQRMSRNLVSMNKPEIVLLCGLCGGVMVLLAVVAYRIELYMELIRALDSWR